MGKSVTASFPVRNVEFDIDESIPKYWHNNRRAVTIFFNNLSTLFPEGEEFFIKSLVAYRSQLDDDQLKAEIKAFTGQEGMHTREHIRYNNMLKAQGYDVDRMERSVKRLLVRVHRRLSKRGQLMVSAALEHWTAMLAHYVLSDDSVLEGAHPVMAGIWRWHAAEEQEHKAVTFDVYERVGGNYPERAVIYTAASFGLWLKVFQQQFDMMRQDGIAFNLREWADLVRFLFVEQRIVQRLGPIVLEYFDPGFHPWHIEDSHLLEKWKLDYETNPVYKKRVKQQPKVRIVPAPA